MDHVYTDSGRQKYQADSQLTTLHRPFRSWMTGSLAVVMASMAPSRGAADQRPESMQVLRRSRYGVAETVQRIEAAARCQGLSVLARLGKTQPVIVLGSSVGGTPMVMNEPDSGLDAPLSVKVRACAGGGAEVLVASDQDVRTTDWQDLPAAVADDLATLPELLERALA
jgi:uncharacterized protein (DUF302 family)